MTARDPMLLLQAAPFLRRGLSTPRLMLEVFLALVPIVIAAVWFFGVGALLVIASATAGAVVTEWIAYRRTVRSGSLRDGSAVLTGVLLGLCLPPGIALWMAFVGGVVSIALGKVVFGGLGQNLFNPALVGRAFLQAAFPTALTRWSAPGAEGGLLAIRPGNLAAPFMQAPVDAVSAATPLGLMKFEGVPTPTMSLMLGDTAGSLGETCGLVILLCGVVMAARRLFDWRIPLAMIGTVAALTPLARFIDPSFPPPGFMIFAGGLLFGAVFMATDPVTSPIAPRGTWLFGIGVGALVVLIRLWGGMAEGVMYAILLMNAATPLIDRVTEPPAFGRGSDR